MGLDMYAVKIRKPTTEEIEKIKQTKELPDNFIGIPAENIDDNDVRDLKPYSEKLSIVTAYIDMAKIRKDFKVEDAMRIGAECYSAEGVKWTFFGNSTSMNVALTQKEIDEKYTITKEEERYVSHGEPIGYWRKAYDLQEAIYDAYDGMIENLGYHKCNEKMISHMIAAPYDAGLHEVIKDDDVIFYHEWY